MSDRRASVGRTWPGLLAAAILGAMTLAAAPAAAPTGPEAPEPITPIPLIPASPADPPAASQADGQAAAALGEMLFSDKSLSGDGQHACASCHDLHTNGASSLAPATALGTPFTTLPVFNAALEYRLGWQGRFRSLEEQAGASLLDPAVMGTTQDAAVRAVRQNRGIDARFHAVFGRKPDWQSLVGSIATFERTLLTPGCRFDQWLAGDRNALSAQEVAGYQTFKSFGCVSCHQGVAVGGNLMERSGVFHALSTPDADAPPSGPTLMLRVPSLRNVAVLAPYFHDGSAPTLERAVTTMGWVQLNRRLTQDETTTIVAFLKTLTGTYQGRTLVPAP